MPVISKTLKDRLDGEINFTIEIWQREFRQVIKEMVMELEYCLVWNQEGWILRVYWPCMSYKYSGTDTVLPF